MSISGTHLRRRAEVLDSPVTASRSVELTCDGEPKCWTHLRWRAEVLFEVFINETVGSDAAGRVCVAVTAASHLRQRPCIAKFHALCNNTIATDERENEAQS